MSVIYCHLCDLNIDTDFDVEHFENHRCESCNSEGWFKTTENGSEIHTPCEKCSGKGYIIFNNGLRLFKNS